MNEIEKLKQELQKSQADLQALQSRIEELEKQESEILWKPDKEEWLYAISFHGDEFCPSYKIKYEDAHECKYFFKNHPDSQKACDYLNRILPLLTLAIQSNPNFGNEERMNASKIKFIIVNTNENPQVARFRELFEDDAIYFPDEQTAEKALKLWIQYEQ